MGLGPGAQGLGVKACLDSNIATWLKDGRHVGLHRMASTNLHTNMQTCIQASIHPSIHPSFLPSIHTDIRTYIHAGLHTYIHTCIHTSTPAYILCIRPVSV